MGRTGAIQEALANCRFPPHHPLRKFGSQFSMTGVDPKRSLHAWLSIEHMNASQPTIILRLAAIINKAKLMILRL